VPRTKRDLTATVRRQVLEVTAPHDFSVIPSVALNDIGEEIDFLLGRLQSVGFNEVIVVDLRRGDLGIPVVRVRVPGLSCFAMDRQRFGWRCARHLL
jgi:ribosomal protein S12 methylthiotransferase accessory factor